MSETPLRTITFSADTGEILGEYPAITGTVGATIAAAVLPGMTPEDVDGMYSAWFDPQHDEDDPLGINRTVLTEFGYHGIVVQRRVTDGVLTGVQVRMDTPAGQSTEWFSPARLIASREGDAE